MADSFQNEVPKARINLKPGLHTGGASKKTGLPLKLLVAGDVSNGQESAPLSERKEISLNKNNFDSVLSESSPKINLTVKNTLADDGSEDNISLAFQSMKDFTPEQVSRQIPQLHLLYPALAGGCESLTLCGAALMNKSELSQIKRVFYPGWLMASQLRGGQEVRDGEGLFRRACRLVQEATR
ncbi:type VI secretion system contractile sheath small subunit [Enterobacter asburiae]|nr:type VI secretion system contractile sheath small subunit [Enterobacter asburiae]